MRDVSPVWLLFFVVSNNYSNNCNYNYNNRQQTTFNAWLIFIHFPVFCCFVFVFFRAVFPLS